MSASSVKLSVIVRSKYLNPFTNCTKSVPMINCRKISTTTARSFGLNTMQTVFYPRDAMLARVIVIATCLSVRLSVTRRYCVKTKKASVMIFHLLVAPWFYFSDAKCHHQILRGSPRTGASKKGGVIKFSDFLALSVNISKTVADTAKYTISVSRTWAFDWHQDRWPWMTVNCCNVKFCQNFVWFRDFGRQKRLHEWR